MNAPLRGDLLQRLRLISGLVLFTFAGTHFLNHAVGLYSLEAMHEVESWRTAVTRSWPGTIVLVAALVTHLSLGLYKLAMRNTLRMPAWEAVQIALGLSIPFLLFPHIVNTRVATRSTTSTTSTSTSWCGCGRSARSGKACCCWSCGCMAASACTTGCDCRRPIAASRFPAAGLRRGPAAGGARRLHGDRPRRQRRHRRSRG